MKFTRFGAALAAALLASAAFGQTQVLDQKPVAYPATPQGELLIQSYPVSGGTLYVSTYRRDDGIAVSQTFAPAAAGGLTRYLQLTNAKADVGVGIAVAPTAATFGINRVAGSALTLVSEATSASAVTNKAVFQMALPDSYVAGANVAFTVNCNYSGSGTVTAASTTLTLNAYSEINGVEAALTMTGAQQIPASPGNLVFTLTGTGLVPGQLVTLEVTSLVTSSAGANTSSINSISYGA